MLIPILLFAVLAVLIIAVIASKSNSDETENDSRTIYQMRNNEVEIGKIEFKIEEVEFAPKRHHETPDEPYKYFVTNVAGVKFHLKPSEANKSYQGKTVADPKNPYNPKAIKLVTNEGKMIGYVKDDDLDSFRDIFGGETANFAALIGWFRNEDDEKLMYGKVMYYDHANDDDESHEMIQERLDKMCEDFTTE